jgi:hypothetical protein
MSNYVHEPFGRAAYDVMIEFTSPQWAAPSLPKDLFSMLPPLPE